MPRAGDVLGRYTILSVLGRGGMGVVYAAEDRTLGRQVALKVLPASDDEEMRGRFLREARAAAAFTHPGIAVLHDVGEIDGRVFIAMELVRGQTLREVLDARPGSPEGRAFPIAEALRIAREIARGLATAHARGIIHRDLKPDNVMIAEEGQVKLLDFGIAKQSDVAGTDFGAGVGRVTMGGTPMPRVTMAGGGASIPAGAAAAAPGMLTEDGCILGTPGYMSPEQAKGRPVDTRTDVFSFGVMLYELCTGARPFTGQTPVELCIALERAEPRPPSELNADVPPEVERVILRCLRKAPEDRYADAGARCSGTSSLPVTTPSHLLPAARGRGSGRRSPPRIGGRRPADRRRRAPRGAVVGAGAAALVAARGVLGRGDADALLVERGGARRLPRRALRAAEGAKHEDLGEAELQAGPSRGSTRRSSRRTSGSRPTGSSGWTRARAGTSARPKSCAASSARATRRSSTPWSRSSGGSPRTGPSRSGALAALLANAPGDAELWYLLGAGHGNYDDFEVAARDLERAIAVDPGFGTASSYLWIMLMYAGRFDEAQRVIDRCLARDPASLECLQSVMRMQNEQGACEAMESTARQAIAANAEIRWGYWYARESRSPRATGPPPACARPCA